MNLLTMSQEAKQKDSWIGSEGPLHETSAVRRDPQAGAGEENSEAQGLGPG